VKKVFKWCLIHEIMELMIRTATDAEDVYVTGTFDSWSKSIKLQKSSAGVLEKEVTLPISEKISYKVCGFLKFILSS
jgi:hypothetical protein